MNKLLIVLAVFLILNLYIMTLFADDFLDTARKAEQLRADGEFVKVAELYETFIETNGSDPIAYYSAACHWSLAGLIDNAFKCLTSAVDNGLYEKDWIIQDEDFVNLRNDERYNELLAFLDKKVKELVSNLPEEHDKGFQIKLPEPVKESEYSIEEVLDKRRSIRNYKDEALTLEEISQILWAAYGVNKPMPDVPYLRGGLKTTPSAGATYPLEVYLLSGNIIDLEAGIYKYIPEEHSLIPVVFGDKREALFKASLQQPWVLEAPASLIYSAIYSRTTDIYGDRGRERYVCMDLGHSAENVYLQAGSMKMGTVAIGAFSDLNVKLLVNMTREEEPLYIMPIGKIE